MNQDILNKLVSEINKDDKITKVYKYEDKEKTCVFSKYRLVTFSNSNNLLIDLENKDASRIVRTMDNLPLFINIDVNKWAELLNKISIKKVAAIDVSISKENQELKIKRVYKKTNSEPEEDIVEKISTEEDLYIKINPKYLKSALALFKKLKYKELKLGFSTATPHYLWVVGEDVNYLIALINRG